METDLFLAQCIGEILALFLGVVFAVSYFFGYIYHENVEPLSFGSLSEDVDDQDIFAIATGNEEYLAAHCTLGNDIKSQKDEIEQEKLDIQRLRNKVARMKLEQQMYEVKNAKKKKTAAQPVEPQHCPKLINDCVAAMVKLGEKKSEAKKIVDGYFLNNPNTKTLDDFMVGVFQR